MMTTFGRRAAPLFLSMVVTAAFAASAAAPVHAQSGGGVAEQVKKLEADLEHPLKH